MLVVIPPLVLGSLAVWFGLVDSPGIGEGRCSSCGVEAYVVAAHVFAAVAIGAVIAAAAPGRATTAALTGVAAITAVGILGADAFGVVAFVALIASFAVIPALLVWWIWAAIRYSRRRPLPRRQQLAAAWLSLVIGVPAVFAWTWIDRVNWLVF